MTSVDPITLEVVSEGFIAIVREMRATVTRTAYSSAVYELDDFSCGLFAPNGELVAQFNDIPSHVIPAPWGVRCTMEDFGDDIHPGDIFLLNDSYRGGTHLNDVTLLYPVFHQGKLFMLPMVRSHWGDVGGMEPGSYSGEATNIYQEGLRIPPIKLYERGKVNTAAMALILSNMRQPDVRLGDIHSAIGACRIAENRILNMLEKYGAPVVSECVRLDLDRSERRLRERIAKLPDGEYVYEDYLEYFDDGAFSIRF
ncbi:MAG: hydantoinase B/oxoprolinase family protein [Variibacter sp.]